MFPCSRFFQHVKYTFLFMLLFTFPFQPLLFKALKINFCLLVFRKVKIREGQICASWQGLWAITGAAKLPPAHYLLLRVFVSNCSMYLSQIAKCISLKVYLMYHLFVLCARRRKNRGICAHCAMCMLFNVYLCQRWVPGWICAFSDNVEWLAGQCQ